MKQRVITIFLIAILTMGLSMVIQADVPQLINYQGRVLDTDGNPVADGAYLIKFIIYDAAAGGTDLWNTGFQTVTLTNGLFEVKLGESPMPPLPGNLFTADTVRYMGITIGVDPEISPRNRFISVPYSYKSLSANTLGSLEPGDVALVSHNHSGVYSAIAHNHDGSYAVVSHTHNAADITAGTLNDARLSSNIPKLNATNTFTNANYFNGDVRVQDSDLHFFRDGVSRWKLNDGVSGSGLRFIQVYNDANTLLNKTRMEISDNGWVGIGTIASPVGKLQVMHDDYYAGYFTSTKASSSTNVIRAQYTGIAGKYDVIAVYGDAWPNDDYGFGGYFEGGYRGVYGYSYNTGVLGYGYSTGTNIVKGVSATANGTTTGGTHYGIYASASGAPINYAGYFSGNVHITGTLSKAGGSFKIDHPLDPENKYLSHSFVESPDMMNVYNGNVVLDGNGQAIVYMPEYFETLNTDFRYQLTSIGAPGPNLYIAEEITSNTFRIAGGEAYTKISWQVTGVRQDPWANQNRIQVEEEKRPEERGKYMHHKAYGVDIEKSIDYEHIKENERDKAAFDK